MIPATVTDWGPLRGKPFDLLSALEQRLRTARLDATAVQARSWTGLGFRVREQWLVVPREDVREVSVLPRLTRIPGAKPWLLGVANVRGSLLPVTDLGLLLDLPRAPANRNQRVLVLNSETLPAGFLVDEVVGYRQFAPADQREELRGASGSFEPHLIGSFHRDGRDWLTLSLQRLIRADIFAHAGG